MLATVVIAAGEVVEVGPPGTQLWRLGDTLIRGDGLYLIPGLIDSCVRTDDPADLHVMVLSGVTTVVVPDRTQCWLLPLMEHPDAALPRLVPESSLPPGAEPTGINRFRGHDRWLAQREGGEVVPLLDPAVAARWGEVAGRVSSGATDSVPSPRSDDPWLPASFAGEPFVEPQFALVEELIALGASGHGTGVCLAKATRLAADELKLPGLGRIAPGAPADLVLLEADPRQDPAALKRIRAVVLRGEVISAARRESTLERLRVLRRSQRLDGQSDAHAELGERSWLLRFDGFPQGLVRISGHSDSAGGIVTESRSLWTPLDSRLRFQGVASPTGGAGSSWNLESRSIGLSVRAVGSQDCWEWAINIAGQDDSEDAEFELGPTSTVPILFFEPWPLMVDLRRLLAQNGRMEASPPTITSVTIVDGSVVLAPRQVERASWQADGHPEATISPGLRRLADSVACSPWSADRVATIVLQEPTRKDNSRPREAVGLAAWLRSLGEGEFQAAAVTLDRHGWPVVGRMAVPGGYWEFHPLDQQRAGSRR